ncbi:O-antigen ligase [Ideonella sp. A 288]|uniref:O-antigen ligase family protein n=1 Tax=Ideonella sp. A 288 TaxID=1962181 RepID=UPI000B4AAEED|nr:O-antigen ligase family protein [Ideonella sp. A 288]
MNPDAVWRGGRAAGAMAAAAAWVVYLPLGLQYLCLFVGGALAARQLTASGQWHELARWPLLRTLLALWLLLAASVAWTDAPRADVASHLWHYGRLMLVPVLAMACPPAAAEQGLRHFIVASVVVALLTLAESLHGLPTSPLWASTLDANGNQRIATSLLMALGTALALWLASDTARPPRQRLAWLLAAVVVALGLSLQDRRTGLVVLPVLLAVLAFARQRSWWRRGLLVGGVMLLALLAWQASGSVRARFDEGLTELKSYRSTGEVATSWGMRVRMFDLTLDMVREKPVLGHGIASWLSLWRARAGGGGALLEAQLTPHNEYLLVTSQVGLIGLGLWLAVLGAGVAQGWRAGRAGHAALLTWVAIATAGLFNVVARDAKFALPLMLLAALAIAASRCAPARDCHG